MKKMKYNIFSLILFFLPAMSLFPLAPETCIEVNKSAVEARKYLINLGADYSRLRPKKPIKYSHSSWGSLKINDIEWEKKMIEKIKLIAQKMKRDIAIHVMASQGLTRIISEKFNGTAIVIRHEFPQMLAKEFEEKNKIKIPDERIVDITSQLFFNDLIELVLCALDYGYHTNTLEQEPALPITLFIDYSSDAVEKGMIIAGENPAVWVKISSDGRAKKVIIMGEDSVFPWGKIFLDYQKIDDFKKRLLGLIHWPEEILLVKQVTDASAPQKKKIIIETFIDKLLEVVENQDSDSQDITGIGNSA